MKRTKDIQECKNLIADKSVDHLHIRRKAVVTDFTNDLKNELEESCYLISIDISEWEYDEVMSTLRWELQRNLSRIDYFLSRLKSIAAGIGLYGLSGSANLEFEKGPEYSRIQNYLSEISNKNDQDTIIFIDYHGPRPVDGFGWIPKLGDLPDNITLITDGYQRCKLENSNQFEIGQLSKKQTVDILTNRLNNISKEEAREAHRVHDGNPVAMEIAIDRGRLNSELTGESLRELWDKVYSDKISAEQLDLLQGSAHLIDLNSRDVAMVVEKTRGECIEILDDLEKQGVVSKKSHGLFTTDKYVKRYITSQLSKSKLSKNHRESFKTYVERWVENYKTRAKDIENSTPDDTDDDIFSKKYDIFYTDPDLYLGIHHLSNIYNELDKDRFIGELKKLDADSSGVFFFGLIAQRFFFEQPKEVISDLSEAILGIDEEIKNEIFSGSIGILFSFDPQEYVKELSKGWSGGINTESLRSYNMSSPDEVVENIQQNYSSDLFQGLPPEVKIAITRLALLIYTDNRKAREYYRQFGRTAEKYGLEEEPFCAFLDELSRFIEVLKTENGESIKDPPERIQSSLDSLNSDIRNRLELQDRLEQNRTKAQRDFQKRLEKIRSRPNEIVTHYMKCGAEISQCSNSFYPYFWFALGDKIFSPILLGQRNHDIYGEYRYWVGKREEEEKNKDSEDMIMSLEEIESALE